MSVSTTIKSIQDIMRKDTGVDGDAQRLTQLVWMFFLKIFDDKEHEFALLDPAYRSPIPKRFQWRTWARDDEGLTGEQLNEFINTELFPKLKELPASNPRARIVRDVFEDSYHYMKSGQLVRQVINKINEIDFNDLKERQHFGDIYEQLLNSLQAAGNAGEYYTPRAVTQFMIDRLDPHPGERLLDPACGTGGFLTCAIDHMRARYVKTVKQEEKMQSGLLAVEKKPLPHLLCVTNMLLHGIDQPGFVRHDNTLTRPLRDYGPADRVDVIATNPPFGGMEEDGIESNFPAAFRTRETADLFLVLLMHLLKDGGRAAVVLPDGTLFGEGIKTRIKEKLLTECNLHTIVRLPNGVFNPYTGIRTNLLFFTKGSPTREVWYYEHPYPPGAKSYNKTKPIRFDEFTPEQAWWGSEADGFKSRVENAQAWRVSFEEIKAANFNLDRKNPHATDDGPGDVDHLLPEYEKLLAQIAATRAALKKELHAALTR